MNPMENELRTLLADKAEEVSMPHGRHSETLGRARRKRAVTGAATVLAACALVAGGVTLAADIGREDGAPRPLPAHREDDATYEFSANPGAFPVIAEGEFRDGTWELRGTPEELAPGVDQIRLKLTVTNGSALRSTTNLVQPGDAALMVVHDDLDGLFEDDAGVVFGATTPNVAAVDVELASSRQTLTAFLATDYDSRSTITASYYVAFVPKDLRGWVVARDAAGVDLEREPMGQVPDDPETVASGKAGDVKWGLSIGRRGRGGPACWTLGGSEHNGCLSAETVADAAPIYLEVSRDFGVTHLVAFLSRPAPVRMTLEGEEPVMLQRFDLPTRMAGRWFRHLVVVGLEAGATGRLEVLNAGGKVVARRTF